MIKALFICSRNALRSPTAEAVANNMAGVFAYSAGTAPDANNPIDAQQIQEADIIFVMEDHHRKKLKQKFSSVLKDKRIVCLAIPDNYDFMQPELVELLERKLPQFLAYQPHQNKKKGM